MRNIRPWCVSRQLWWGHRLPVWYCDECGEIVVAESTPERCPNGHAALRQDEDVLDTWFSSALWPFATLGWPDDTPELRAFYPTSFLTTAREIIFLWVARMVMMGLEFAGEIPFRDVYVHSVIQAPDGRRMSKSLGTGIDPLDEIDAHGADALRFGLLAMSSTQDVRYSKERIQQGLDLANKMWNASRLILLNAGDRDPAPRALRPEDRWILSRLQRAIESVTANLDSYDFSHAALELYRFFWSELCDWYLEIVKPRLYDGEPEASANLLWVLEQVLALAHPIMPFVTEEIWSYAPHGGAGQPLVVSEFPSHDAALVDEAAEAEVEAAIELTRSLRRWRDLAGVAGGDGACGAGQRRCCPARARRAPGADLVRRIRRRARRSPRSARWRSSPATRSTPIRSGGGSTSGAASCAPRSSAPSASSPTTASPRRRPPTSSRPSAASLPPTAPSSRSSGSSAVTTEGAAWDYADAERWLASLEPIGWKLGLERMRRLTSVLGMPQRRFASIHVVGTNGKSSVAVMTAALLEAHGVRSGAYLSPHVERWTERIQIAGEEIGEAEFAAAIQRVAESVEAVNRTLEEDEVVTQFEAVTAAAFVALAASRVEVAVIEAGLGGRLDATNVIPSRVCALTSVGLEHTEWLGETPEEIAAEKLAVLRDHSTLVVGELSPRGRRAGRAGGRRAPRHARPSAPQPAARAACARPLSAPQLRRRARLRRGRAGPPRRGARRAGSPPRSSSRAASRSSTAIRR